MRAKEVHQRAYKRAPRTLARRYNQAMPTRTMLSVNVIQPGRCLLFICHAIYEARCPKTLEEFRCVNQSCLYRRSPCWRSPRRRLKPCHFRAMSAVSLHRRLFWSRVVAVQAFIAAPAAAAYQMLSLWPSLTGRAPAGAFTTVVGAVQPAGYIAANANARPPQWRPLFISFAGRAVSSID
jgi:hypothetical protein